MGGANDTPPTVAQIFNSAVAASALSAAWEIGVLDELVVSGGLDIREFADAHDLALDPIVDLFRALAAVRIVDRDGTRVTPAENFSEANRNRAFFHWFTRGSAELFSNIPHLVREKNRIETFYRRDAAAVAFACREIDEVTYASWFWDAICDLEVDPRVVADLGCGSGERVIQLLKRYPAAHAIGVDVAASAVRVAERAAAEAGVGSRATFLTADVTRITEDPLFERALADVDLITCFMMGHDLWPRARCVAVLRHLRAASPKLRRLILGDATRTVGVADEDSPVFALAFDLGHALMGTFIPTADEWESALSEAGWRICRKQWINLAVGEAIFEAEPA